MMRIAVCQYQFTEDDTSDYPTKIEKIMMTAKHHDADLIMFPEYIGMQSGFPGCKSDSSLFASMQTEMDNYLAMFQRFSKEFSMYIQAGTTLVAAGGDRYYNRAYLFSPDGRNSYQDKLQLTSYEKESNVIARGTQQTIFSTPLGSIGIAICYDSEFPEIVRQLVNAGAQLILVPTYTTTFSGYYRVQLSCRARAIENQCYVAMSPMVGQVEMGGKEQTFGAAGIFGPADIDFPVDGIIAQGKLNQPEIIFGDISFDKINYVRKHGHVNNFTDAEYFKTIAGKVNIIDL